MVQYDLKKFIGETKQDVSLKTNTSDMANSKMAKVTSTDILLPVEKMTICIVEALIFIFISYD